MRIYQNTPVRTITQPRDFYPLPLSSNRHQDTHTLPLRCRIGVNSHLRLVRKCSEGMRDAPHAARCNVDQGEYRITNNRISKFEVRAGRVGGGSSPHPRTASAIAAWRISAATEINGRRSAVSDCVVRNPSEYVRNC